MKTSLSNHRAEETGESASDRQLKGSDNIRSLLNRLACPKCLGALDWQEGSLHCTSCIESYPLIDGIADLRTTEDRTRPEVVEWSKHWSEGHQQSLSQRFFSFYRKFVFARTVRHFVERYFNGNGLFVEAGSGTSETSMRIDKHDGARTLVAADIVLPVLTMCHPIMDVRVCSDIFRLPFLSDSVDGIWNVGVMEHFTHDEIDQVMGEFHRVLIPGGRIILLWPGTDSIPQRMLHAVERVVNIKRRHERFRFHHIPDEISQLGSSQEAQDVMKRNGFNSLHIDNGLKSLMAFKVLVGEKNTIRGNL